MDARHAGDLSTLFDVGGIIGEFYKVGSVSQGGNIGGPEPYGDESWASRPLITLPWKDATSGGP